MPAPQKNIILNVILSVFVFYISFFFTYAVADPVYFCRTSASFLATVADGVLRNNIKNITVTVGNGLSEPYKAEITWSGGSKPYFVDYKSVNGWITVGTAHNTKKYIHEIPQIESTRSEQCYRIGYVKQVGGTDMTYITTPTCINLVPGLPSGEMMTKNASLKFKTVTLFESSENPEYAYRARVEISGGSAPYTVHAQSGSRIWTVVGNTTEKSLTVPIPRSITQGESNICLMLQYQKMIQNVPVHMLSEPVCTSLLSAIPNSGEDGVPVRNIKASKITHYNAKLTWTKSREDIDGYAIYLEGELVAQTRTNSYTEEPILMPETTYTYAIRTIPRNTVPTEELPEVVGVAANAGIFNLTTKVAPPVPTKGDVRILAIQMKFADTRDTDYTETTERITRKIFGSTDSIKAKWEAFSNGKLRISGDVANDIIILSENRPDHYMSDDFNDVYDDKKIWLEMLRKHVSLNPEYSIYKYDTIIVILPEIDSAISGKVDDIGSSGGDLAKGIIWINNFQGYSVYVHEFGHKLGLYHAYANRCVFFPDDYCPRINNVYQMTPVDYGDNLDVMGRGVKMIDSYRRFQLGWTKSKMLISTGFYEIGNSLDNTSTLIQLPGGKRQNPESINYYFEYVPDNLSLIMKTYWVNNNEEYRRQNYDRTKFSYVLTVSAAPDNAPYNLFTGNEIKTRFTDDVTNSSAFSSEMLWKVVPIKKDNYKATIFVRFLEGSIPTLTATPTQNNTRAVLRWTAIDKATGYELYRNSTSTAPIYTGSALTFTDTVSGNNKYYVRAYDAFTELPNRKYYMDFSAEASTAISGYDEDPNPSNDPFVWIDNPCPGVGISPKIVLSGVTELLTRARQNRGTNKIGVHIEYSTTGNATDWQTEVYNTYGLNIRGEDIYLLQNLENTGSSHWYRVTIESIDSSGNWVGDIDLFNNELYYRVGGNCKVAEMKSTANGCSSRVKDVIYKRGTLYATQTPDFPSSCPFNKLEITNDDLLQPAIITTLPDLNWYDRFDFLNNITLIPSQTGVSVELPYHIQGVAGGANARSTNRRVGTIYAPTLIQRLTERPRR